MTIASDTTRRPKFGLQHRLVLARETAKLEQADLAEALGVGRSTVSNYERGVTPPKKLVLKEWALATGVDFDWLATGADAPDGVHPPGLEPGTHWLRASNITELRPPVRRDERGPGRRAA